jgi:hypothetical protein
VVAAFEADVALQDALLSDDKPTYQRWAQVGGLWTLSANGEPHRVGKNSLHGAKPETVARALALHGKHLPLPDIQGCKQRYSVTVDDTAVGQPFDAGPIEPWNGEEFDGFLTWVDDSIPSAPQAYRAQVVFFWNGERYEHEDVERYWMKDQGSFLVELTEDERTTLKTGVALDRVREIPDLAAYIAESIRWQETLPDGVASTRRMIMSQYSEFPSREYAVEQWEKEREEARVARGRRDVQEAKVARLLPEYLRRLKRR